MSKFHVNSKGLAAPCRATKGRCPFGGESEHYSSKEEAQEAAQKQNEKEYGLMSNVESSNNSTFEGRNEILRGIKNTDERERKAHEMFVETEIKPKFAEIKKNMKDNEKAFQAISKVVNSEKDLSERQKADRNPVQAVETAYSKGLIKDSEVESLRKDAKTVKNFYDNFEKTRANLDKSVEKYIDFNVIRNGRAKSDLVYEFKDEVLSDDKVLSYLSEQKK